MDEPEPTIDPLRRPERPLLAYDGECPFCRAMVRLGRRLTGERARFEPLQQVAGDFPEIPRAAFERSVHLIEPDGRVSSGAHATFRLLALAGRGWGLPLRLYRRVPGFAPASEWAYRFISNRRPLLSRLFERKPR